MNIEQYGFHPAMLPENNTAGIPARVTTVYRDRFAIICEQGEGFAHLKSSAYRAEDAIVPTTGDFVLLDWRVDGESRILKTLPRKTYFARRDPSAAGHGEQAVAANFDFVFLVQALDRPFNARSLERYLALAWQSGAVPAIVLTKADAAENTADILRAAERLAIGVCVFAVSAHNGAGLDQLKDYLKPGKTIVFLGPSGAGKSSLVNALAGECRMKTGDVRAADGRGRHTTTQRQLLRLKSGVLVIDTPGMRELGMWDASEGLEQSFADIEPYLGRCKFSDCRHQSEPGCAIRTAIQCGTLSPARWESYQKLHAEARFMEDKEEYLREKRQRFKDIAKLQRQMQQTDYRHTPCTESFSCKVCGTRIVPEGAGSGHRNHCPNCLSSIHVDNQPGDRASLCKGVMDPVGVWVRKNGEWAMIHRCRLCGTFSSNRIAADDNATLLMSIAMRPLASPPFPLWQIGQQPPETR